MPTSSVTDWIEALSTSVAALTAVTAGYIGIRTFQHQRTSNDVQLALQIFQNIAGYWNRIIDEQGSYEYNVGQVLAQFEIAATLFNHKVLTNDALPLLKDHIIEVFAKLTASDQERAIIEMCRSSPTTFVELQKFFRQHFPTALNAISFASDTDPQD